MTPDLKAVGILISEKNIHGTKKLTLEKEVKVSPPSPPSPPSQAKPIYSTNLQGGDKGGDTFEGGDKGGDKKDSIATRETTAQQGVEDLGGDGGDEISLLSKSKTSPRTLKVGDRVKYIGTDKVLQKQYAGILEVHTIANDCCSCLKPNGTGLTSWIEFEDPASQSRWQSNDRTFQRYHRFGNEFCSSSTRCLSSKCAESAAKGCTN